MKECKLLQDSIFVLILLTTCSQCCNVNPSSQIIGRSNSDLLPYGDPPPVTVNPHLELVDEQYSKCRGIEIREISVLEIQSLFAEKRLTTVELTKCYLERINRMNQALRAVVEINPDALNEAFRLDIERISGRSRGAMHGIPVLLKDAIGTLDMTETTIGSPALVGIRPKMEADVVKTLRNAGALILGKSNCQEFYGFRGTNIPWGWSGNGGQTRNAYNLSVSPGGSSSGSGVGVAANLVPVAVGSETDGSILVPASLSGIVGMKPTFGLLSVKGVIPFSHNQDHIGPMAKTVLDATILLDAMISESERPPHHPRSYTQSLLENNLQGPYRVGVLRFPFWDTSVIASVNLQYELPQLERMLQIMENFEGFQVIDPVEPSYRNVSASKMAIMFDHDFKHDFNEYLKNDVVGSYSLPRPPNPFKPSLHSVISAVISPPRIRIASLADVIAYNNEHPTREGYNQEHLVRAQTTDGLLNKTYVDARDKNRVAAQEFLDSVFQQYNLDVIMVPSEYRLEEILEESLEDFPVYGFTVACIAGYPSITIPAGIGLRESPFGVTFIAKPYDEPTLIQTAYIAEQLNPKRTAPHFLI